MMNDACFESVGAARMVFDRALQAVEPRQAVARVLDRVLAPLEVGRGLSMVAIGKAAAPMAQALLERVEPSQVNGVVITKYDHLGAHRFPKGISVHEAGHPIPDANGVRASEAVLQLLKGTRPDALVVFLISGGGSALLVCPCPGVSLEDKQAVTRLLLNSGASIDELNAVRKHLSSVKGGRLAELAYPAKVVSLILSDVIGDPIDVIASGPTAPDHSTYSDAIQVLRRYDLLGKVPRSVLERLSSGEQGRASETPKAGDQVFAQVNNVIVGSNGLAVEAAKEAAARLGYRPHVLSKSLTGEASMVGRDLARQARAVQETLHQGERICLIAGGETTVTVRGNGKGGRNTELAAAFASEIAGREGITFLSAGTDGTDGPTDAAGAIATSRTVGDASANGLDVHDYLARNDTYNFFKGVGGLVITGPTGTNVMDLQLVLVEQ